MNMRVLFPLTFPQDTSPLISGDTENKAKKGTDGKIYVPKVDGGGGGSSFPAAPAPGSEITTGYIGGNLLGEVEEGYGHADDLTIALQPGVYQVLGDENGSCGSVEGLPNPGYYRLILSPWFDSPEPKDLYDKLQEWGGGLQCTLPLQEQILYDFGSGRAFVRSAYQWDVSGNPNIGGNPDVRTLHSKWSRMGGGGLREVSRCEQSGVWEIKDLSPSIPFYLFYNAGDTTTGNYGAFTVMLFHQSGVEHLGDGQPIVITAAGINSSILIPSGDTVTFQVDMQPGDAGEYVVAMQ